MATKLGPKVSIGLPVYNGENYVATAIESVLAQTYPDFELVICDNASTDSTETICRSYTERDRRIRYHKNTKNIGAAPNFNRVFELSSPQAEFFKWLGHDDTIAPDCIEKCVTALDADPGAVLCASLISMIDDEGKRLYVYDSKLFATRTSNRPSDRFKDTILKIHLNYDCFGLIRRSALAGSLMHPSYFMGERLIVVELSLMGRFIMLQEPLFAIRDHGERATKAFTRLNWLDNEDTGASRWQRFGLAMMYRDYWRAVNRHVHDVGERLRCYRHLMQWWFTAYHAKLFCADFITFLSPRAFIALRDLKQRLEGQRRINPAS